MRGVQYAIYSTRGVVSCLIKLSTSPRALSATRPLLSYCKSRTALRARINYNLWYYFACNISDGMMPTVSIATAIIPRLSNTNVAKIVYALPVSQRIRSGSRICSGGTYTLADLFRFSKNSADLFRVSCFERNLGIKHWRRQNILNKFKISRCSAI